MSGIKPARMKTRFVLLSAILIAHWHCSNPPEPGRSAPMPDTPPPSPIDSTIIYERIDTAYSNGDTLRLTLQQKGVDRFALFYYSSGGRVVEKTIELGSMMAEDHFSSMYLYDGPHCSMSKFLFKDGVFIFSTDVYSVGIWHHVFKIQKNDLIAQDEVEKGFAAFLSTAGGLLFNTKTNGLYTLYAYRGTQDFNIKKWRIRNGKVSFVRKFEDYSLDFDNAGTDPCALQAIVSK